MLEIIDIIVNKRRYFLPFTDYELFADLGQESKYKNSLLSATL